MNGHLLPAQVLQSLYNMICHFMLEETFRVSDFWKHLMEETQKIDHQTLGLP